MAQYRTGAFQTGRQFIPDPRVAEAAQFQQLALQRQAQAQAQSQAAFEQALAGKQLSERAREFDAGQAQQFGLARFGAEQDAAQQALQNQFLGDQERQRQSVAARNYDLSRADELAVQAWKERLSEQTVAKDDRRYADTQGRLRTQDERVAEDRARQTLEFEQQQAELQRQLEQRAFNETGQGAPVASGPGLSALLGGASFGQGDFGTRAVPQGWIEQRDLARRQAEAEVAGLEARTRNEELLYEDTGGGGAPRRRRRGGGGGDEAQLREQSLKAVAARLTKGPLADMISDVSDVKPRALAADVALGFAEVNDPDAADMFLEGIQQLNPEDFAPAGSTDPKAEGAQGLLDFLRMARSKYDAAYRRMGLEPRGPAQAPLDLERTSVPAPGPAGPTPADVSFPLTGGVAPGERAYAPPQAAPPPYAGPGGSTQFGPVPAPIDQPLAQGQPAQGQPAYTFLSGLGQAASELTAPFRGKEPLFPAAPAPDPNAPTRWPGFGEQAASVANTLRGLAGVAPDSYIGGRLGSLGGEVRTDIERIKGIPGAISDALSGMGRSISDALPGPATVPPDRLTPPPDLLAPPLTWEEAIKRLKRERDRKKRDRAAAAPTRVMPQGTGDFLDELIIGPSGGAVPLPPDASLFSVPGGRPGRGATEGAMDAMRTMAENLALQGMGLPAQKAAAEGGKKAVPGLRSRADFLFDVLRETSTGLSWDAAVERVKKDRAKKKRRK